MARVESRLSNTGTRTKSTWCDPRRGLPADAALGIERPLQLGVSSIVHRADSTTESFIAERALHQSFALPARNVDVGLIDHPADADYSISGNVDGWIKYARESDMSFAPHVIATLGLLVGASFTGTAVLINAVDDGRGDFVMTPGLLLLGVGVGGLIYMASRPANHYTWDQTATLVIRRGSVVIGEVVVNDTHDDITYQPLRGLRETSERQLWKRAAREVSACIAADLAGAAATGNVAEVTP
jgi:hypothetical protein